MLLTKLEQSLASMHTVLLEEFTFLTSSEHFADRAGWGVDERGKFISGLKPVTKPVGHDYNWRGEIKNKSVGLGWAAHHFSVPK